MSDDWCLYEKKRGQHGDTQRKKGHVRMKAGREVGRRHLQAEDAGKSRRYQKLKESGKDSSWKLQRKHGPTDPLSLDF